MMAVDPLTSIQMKQKELTRTFIMISNWFLWFIEKYFSVLRVKTNRDYGLPMPGERRASERNASQPDQKVFAGSCQHDVLAMSKSSGAPFNGNLRTTSLFT